MERADVDVIIADVLAEHFTRLRVDLTKHIDTAIAARALPPFVPPQAWTSGRHGAGTIVRHRNGVFHARRDTASEPGVDEAWLPLIVGIASIDFAWAQDDRSLSVRACLSDGSVVETLCELAVPLSRGFWSAEAAYKPGDRVFRFGEFQATAPSQGVDPSAPEGVSAWMRVVGKHARPVSFTIDDEGTIFESGHEVGTLKPMVAGLFSKLVGEARDG